MPLYFFNIKGDFSVVTDRTGTYLPDLESAIERAHIEGDLIVGALSAKPELLKGLRVHILDADGKLLKMVDLPAASDFPR